MVKIASRASWGARHTHGDGIVAQRADEIAIHHTAGTTLPATATVAQEQAVMRSLEQTGQNRFRRGISYHVVVFPSGRAYQGLAYYRRGTHVGGRNTRSRGLAFAGSHHIHQPTPQAVATMAQIIAAKRGRWWTKNATVNPHSAWSATACPGQHVNAVMAQLRTGTTSVIQGPVGSVSSTTEMRRGPANTARNRKLQKGLKRVFPSYELAPRIIARVGRGSRSRLVSGVFGPVTEVWVEEFQIRVGLPATGVVNNATGQALARHGIRGLGW